MSPTNGRFADVSSADVPTNGRAPHPSIGSVPSTPSAADLLRRELPESRCAIEGILPEGLSILAGKPKLGKSWLALSFCVSVALGATALGGVPVAGGDALYLGLEDNERRLRDRLLKLLGGRAAPARLFYRTDWRRADKGGVQDLGLWLAENPATRLVVIDTFARIRRPSRGKSVYQEDYEAVAELKAMADRHRVAVLLILHLRKADADDAFDGVSGTLGLTGAADGVLILKRDRGQHDATLHVTGRDIAERELAMRWDASSFAWTLLGNAERFRLSPERRAVLDLLANAGDPMQPKAIAQALGKGDVKGRAAVRRMLGDMLKDGQVRCGDDGRYVPITALTGSQVVTGSQLIHL